MVNDERNRVHRPVQSQISNTNNAAGENWSHTMKLFLVGPDSPNDLVRPSKQPEAETMQTTTPIGRISVGPPRLKLPPSRKVLENKYLARSVSSDLQIMSLV